MTQLDEIIALERTNMSLAASEAIDDFKQGNCSAEEALYSLQSIVDKMLNLSLDKIVKEKDVQRHLQDS